MGNQPNEETADDQVSGDPGVAGILADPLARSKHQKPDLDAEVPSPDPAPPKHHGEWTPTDSQH